MYRLTKPGTTTKSYDNTNLEAKDTAENLDLADRIDTMAEKHAFVTLKDHKPNFENNPSCRLINPAKSEIGKISKAILDINTAVRKSSQVNQWRSTTETIDWFKKINMINPTAVLWSSISLSFILPSVPAS